MKYKMSRDYQEYLKSRKPIIIFKTPGRPKIIAPLNTDISIKSLKTFDSNGLYARMAATESEQKHPDNFSWHISTNYDSDIILKKKLLISPVQDQHMCGSCWAVALSSCISDCFVVSGAVDWIPKISPTFLMMNIPTDKGNGKCNGGNPAQVVSALESISVTDTTCVDYSWCSNNPECTSLTGQVSGDDLNKNIPSFSNSCYFQGNKLLYRIDPGSEAIFIGEKYSEDTFRHKVKDHIMKYGPVITGFTVLKNFISGKFTNPSVNNGIYFEKGDYPNDKMKFLNQESDVIGFHAIEIVGWGTENAEYEPGKLGPVQYWIGKNSWGLDWGYMGGFFKIAMYPWNKLAQFGKQINVHGTTIGGVIMLRCTKPPIVEYLKNFPVDNIKKSMPDDYYMFNRKLESTTSNNSNDINDSFVIILGIISVILIFFLVR